MNNPLTISNWQQAFLLAITDLLTNIFSYLPVLLGALLVFVAGVMFGKWTKIIIVKILGKINLSFLAKSSGLEKFLKKAEIKIKIEEIVGEIFKWIIILIFSITTINLLGLSTVSLVLNNILAYVPKVISAILVLTAGILLAGLVESLVKGTLAQIDLKTSRLLAKLSSYLIVIFAILAAINELGIAKTFVNALFFGFVGMLALGFGLALGLGAKDLVAQILKEWYEGFKKEIKK